MDKKIRQKNTINENKIRIFTQVAKEEAQENFCAKAGEVTIANIAKVTICPRRALFLTTKGEENVCDYINGAIHLIR